MDDLNFLGIFAGLLAYCIAVLLGTGPVIFAAYWVDKTLTKRIDEDEALKKGHRPIAIELGATILCQAILIRHAVFAAMAVIRVLFVEELSWSQRFWVIGRSGMCVVVILILALVSVQVSSFIFKKMMRHMNVDDAIRKNNNTAMAIFLAFVLLAITLVLNEGMEDFSRSLIPYGRAGIISLS